MAERTYSAAEKDAIDAFVDQIRIDRLNAPTLSALYDEACERITELKAERDAASQHCKETAGE